MCFCSYIHHTKHVMKIEYKKFREFPRGIMVSLLKDAYAFEPMFEKDWLERWQSDENFFYDSPDIADECGFITTVDGIPIGFICWDPRNTPESAELGNNCIVSGYKGKGYGKLQLQEAVKRIEEKHINKILVTTNYKLTAAQKNYESVGFRWKQNRYNEWDHGYAGEFMDYELNIQESKMNIIYSAKKELPNEQLRDLFQAVGWSDGNETTEMLSQFNVPFLNSTIVLSAWDDNRLVGCIRALSDRMFRSVIYDLAVFPEYQGQGIGSQLLIKCRNIYPDSEWVVATVPERVSFYEKHGYQLEETPYLKMKSKWF